MLESVDKWQNRAEITFIKSVQSIQATDSKRVIIFESIQTDLYYFEL